MNPFVWLVLNLFLLLSDIQAPSHSVHLAFFSANQGWANRRNQNQKSKLHKLTTWLQVEPALRGNVTASITSQEFQDFTKWPKQLFIRKCVGLNVHKLEPNSNLLPTTTKALSLDCCVSHNGRFFLPLFFICCAAVLRRKTLWKWQSWRTSRTPATWSSSDQDTSMLSWCLLMPLRLHYSGNLPRRFFPFLGKSQECIYSFCRLYYSLSLLK